MINCKDIAKLAGVSPATVARVFAQPELVKDKTRCRILSVAKKYHYTPNYAARTLRSAQSDVVGMIISDIRNPFFTLISSALQEKLKGMGLRLVVHFSSENSKTEEEGISSLLSERANIVLFTPTKYSQQIENKLLMNDVFGLQLFRKAYSNINSITVNDMEGTYIAVKRLIEANHTKILLLDGWSNIETHRDEGYIKAMEESKIAVNAAYIKKLKLEENQMENIIQLITTLQPTAIISVTEKITFDLLEAMKLTNKRLKDDISVIAYDDCLLAKYMNLTTITHDTTNIIDSIISRLLQRTEGDDTISHAVLLPFILERDSVKNIKEG